MELHTAILHSCYSLPPRFSTLKTAPDFASPFSFFITSSSTTSLRHSSFPLTYKDQQHSFPIVDGARFGLNCIGERLSCTSTSGSASSYDDPSGGYEKRDDNDNEQMIRDCDKLIEAFIMDESTLADWRRLLVFNNKWSNIRLHFFRHCQDRADSEDDLLVKNKLLWLGMKLKEIDEDIERHNELIEMIKRTPSEISDIVSRSRKDFTEEFFLHLHTVAESYNDNPKAQNALLSYELDTF